MPVAYGVILPVRVARFEVHKFHLYLVIRCRIIGEDSS